MEENAVIIYIFNLLLCFGMAFLLAKIYERFGSAISYKGGFAKIFPLLAITTLVIISIVKTSIALSLGLVGALSIVRFRSAIKEPEELAYLFICIAIGLGLGANQQLYTAIGFVVLVLAILILGRNNVIRKRYNYFVIVKSKDQEIDVTNVNGIVGNSSMQFVVQRIEQSDRQMVLHYRLEIKNNSQLEELNRSLTARGFDVSIISNN